MKNLRVGSLLVCTLLLCLPLPRVGAEEATSAKASDQKIVVHLSHFTDDLHRCFMAFKVASLMQDSGAQVAIFLDLEGVRLAARRQSLAMTWGEKSPPLADLYEQFTTGGGKIILCPHCAELARLNDPGLKRHAEIGTAGTLAEMLIEADKVIDY